MTPRFSGHFSIFGLVFFVLKSLLGIARQQSRENFSILPPKWGGGGGQGGWSPGEQGAGGVREAGEERAGGGISTMAGSGREIQNVKLFFVTAYFQSKKRTQQRFLTSI